MGLDRTFQEYLRVLDQAEERVTTRLQWTNAQLGALPDELRPPFIRLQKVQEDALREIRADRAEMTKMYDESTVVMMRPWAP